MILGQVFNPKTICVNLESEEKEEVFEELVEKVIALKPNLNRQNILNELNGLINHLQVYADALEKEDDEALSNALKEGRLIRETIRRKDD